MCSCAAFIVKYVLFFVNLVFFLAGLALLGIGIAVKFNISEVVDLVPINLEAIPIIVITLGAIIAVIAFLGCCGAIKEGRCLLTMYGICMIILAGFKVWLAVMIFGALNNVNESVNTWITDAFNNQEMKEPFIAMEMFLKCCGTTGPGSYPVDEISPGCCNSLSLNITNGIDISELDISELDISELDIDNLRCTMQNSYEGGCIDIFSDYLSTFGNVFGIILVVIIGAELLIMLLSFFLCTNVSNKNRRKLEQRW